MKNQLYLRSVVANQLEQIKHLVSAGKLESGL
jgi:hypothetical protein